MRIARQSEQRTQRYQRQQAVAQRHHAQHRGLGARDLRHLIRQRNDLSHAVERQGVFLRSQFEAHQRHVIRFGSRRGQCCSRNRKLGRGAWTGGAQPGERVAKQPLRIQYLDRAFAFGAFDHAIQKVRVDGPRAGIVVLDPARRKRDQIVDAIDDKPDGRRALDHDHSRPLIRRRIREVKQASQADDRQYCAAQVGQSQKASRSQRHMGNPWHPHDLADVVEPEAEQVVRYPKDDQMLVLGLPHVRGRRRHRGLGTRCVDLRADRRLRLAIAALDVFSERGDLFNRRREILGTARLLPGGGRRLC